MTDDNDISEDRTKRSRETTEDEDDNSSSAPLIDGETEDARASRLLESKRAYNRMISARARKRSKDLVADLTRQLQTYVTSQQELQRENAELNTRISYLEGENQLLRSFIGPEGTQTIMKSAAKASTTGAAAPSVHSSTMLQAQNDSQAQMIERLLNRSAEQQLVQQQLDQLQKQFQPQAATTSLLETSNRTNVGTESISALLQLLQQQQQQPEGIGSHGQGTTAPTAPAAYPQQLQLTSNNIANGLWASQLLGNPPQQISRPMQQRQSQPSLQQQQQQAALISNLFEKIQQQQHQQQEQQQQEPATKLN